jgi:hypothetical protein
MLAFFGVGFQIYGPMGRCDYPYIHSFLVRCAENAKWDDRLFQFICRALSSPKPLNRFGCNLVSVVYAETRRVNFILLVIDVHKNKLILYVK